MLLATLRRRTWYLAALGTVSVIGFLGLSTGLSGAASAVDTSVGPADQLSSEIAQFPSRSAAQPVAAVVSARSGGCGTEQLTALAPEDCR